MNILIKRIKNGNTFTPQKRCFQHIPMPGSGNHVLKNSLSEEAAVAEARRCLNNTRCDNCGICALFCPDLCIRFDEKTQKMEIDYGFCKGCGICAVVCPKGAITMYVE